MSMESGNQTLEFTALSPGHAEEPMSTELHELSTYNTTATHTQFIYNVWLCEMPTKNV